MVTVEQWIKLVLRHSLCKLMLIYWSSVADTQFHLYYFLSSQVTHKYILLLLCEMHNALQLPMFLFSFFLFFCQPCLKYREFGAKKCYIDHWTANAIQLFVPIKRKFFESILFQKKLQRRGIPQGLRDKYSHLFICISKTCLYCQNPNIRTNSLCCSALLWTSFCFLHVNQ